MMKFRNDSEQSRVQQKTSYFIRNLPNRQEVDNKQTVRELIPTKNRSNFSPENNVLSHQSAQTNLQMVQRGKKSFTRT